MSSMVANERHKTADNCNIFVTTERAARVGNTLLRLLCSRGGNFYVGNYSSSAAQTLPPRVMYHISVY
jgi:hypothetical protein